MQVWNRDAGWLTDPRFDRNKHTRQALAEWKHARWLEKVDAHRQRQIALARQPRQQRLAEANRQKQIAAACAERQRMAAADARILSRWTMQNDSRLRRLQSLPQWRLSSRNRTELQRLEMKHEECISRAMDVMTIKALKRVSYANTRLTTQTIKLSGGGIETKRRRH